MCFIGHFTMGVNWIETVRLLEVSTMFYKSTYCVFPFQLVFVSKAWLPINFWQIWGLLLVNMFECPFEFIRTQSKFSTLFFSLGTAWPDHVTGKVWWYDYDRKFTDMGLFQVISPFSSMQNSERIISLTLNT